METADAERSKITEHIGAFGWHCLHVHPVEPGQDLFSYSIGFAESFGAPEVMIFGLATDLAHSLLTECATLLKAGHTILSDTPDTNVLAGGYSVVFKRVAREHFPNYLGTALRYYGARPFSSVVMFLPDKAHRLPWEAGYDGISVDEPLAIV